MAISNVGANTCRLTEHFAMSVCYTVQSDCTVCVSRQIVPMQVCMQMPISSHLKLSPCCGAPHCHTGLSVATEADAGPSYSAALQQWCLRVCVGWQESFRAEGGDAAAPLLGKPLAADSAGTSTKQEPITKKNETETIKALLRMSAVDTPLLLLAFAAGSPPCHVPAQKAVVKRHK